MTLTNLPHRVDPINPEMAAPKVEENLDSILTTVNGGIDRDNLAPGVVDSIVEETLALVPPIPPASGLYYDNFRQSSWTGFAPSIAGISFGTGGVASAVWAMGSDKFFAARYYIAMGTGVPTVGSAIAIGFPAPVQTVGLGGQGHCYDNSAAGVYMLLPIPASSTTFSLRTTGMPSGLVGPGVPFIWAASDLVWSGFVCGELA